MFWEEKIDRIKKKFTQDEFRAPFTEWSKILKRLEENFFRGGQVAYRYRNWSESLQGRPAFCCISRQSIGEAISILPSNSNFWVIIVFSNDTTARQHVYDCRPNAMEHLISIAPANFYIGDKKYNWLVYFEMNSTGDQLSMIKVRDSQTPFDHLRSTLLP